MKKRFVMSFSSEVFHLSGRKKWMWFIKKRYKNIKGQRLDLIVSGEVVVEIKSVRKLEDVFTAQVLSYLKSTGLKRALLINFGQKRLVDGVTRVSL